MRLLHRKTKHLNTTLLRRYRNEAYGRLSFDGGWSGYWHTAIDGISYRSAMVPRINYLTGNYGNFVVDAILDRVRLERNKYALMTARNFAKYGKARIIFEDSRVQQQEY